MNKNLQKKEQRNIYFGENLCSCLLNLKNTGTTAIKYAKGLVNITIHRKAFTKLTWNKGIKKKNKVGASLMIHVVSSGN